MTDKEKQFDHREEEERRMQAKIASQQPKRLTPYERTRAQVYASGNKWAIENFNATHN